MQRTALPAKVSRFSLYSVSRACCQSRKVFCSNDLQHFHAPHHQYLAEGHRHRSLGQAQRRPRFSIVFAMLGRRPCSSNGRCEVYPGINAGANTASRESPINRATVENGSCTRRPSARPVDGSSSCIVSRYLSTRHESAADRGCLVRRPLCRSSPLLGRGAVAGPIWFGCGSIPTAWRTS